MKLKVITTLFVLMTSASLFAADAPSVEAQLLQINQSPEMFTFRGPVNLQYQLTVTNPLVNSGITLTRITLRTQGKGSYSLHADDPIQFPIDPDRSATISLSAWAHSNGGFMSRQPVEMVIQLWFDRQNGQPFTRQYIQTVPQF